MPARHLRVRDDVPAQLTDGMHRLEDELDIPVDFPPEVTAAAEQAGARPRLPDLDLTGLAFVTIDPPDSMDLDQAVFIERTGDGFTVHYAIADVAAFVTAGDPIDVEAHRRGQTLYAPNRRIPLHPPELSEAAASLLPDQDKPALVWQLHLDASGELEDFEVRRARVRSRAKLSYDGVQEALDNGTADESLQLLREVGRLRERKEIERGGVSLNLPEQEVQVEDDQWVLTFRTPLPVEGWNAQISLLTGMAAAKAMLQAKVGVLRTLPPADEGSLRRLRQTAKALHIPWPDGMTYPDFVRSLDPATPSHSAMLNACTMLFRGAGYTAFQGTVPAQTTHAALAIEYAHTTAPLRRLVDRYVGETCVAICAGQPVPEWVLAALDALPTEMEESEKKAKKFERGIVDLVEALVLSGREGQEFTGVIVDVDRDGGKGRVHLNDPAVEATVTGTDLPLGQEVQVRLVSVDLVAGRATFALS